jgi:hypothetical protein
MTEVLANVMTQRFANLPAECSVREMDIRLLSGVPHCGSPSSEQGCLPPCSVVSVNADTVLCEENSILRGCVKPPVATAIFKVGMEGIIRETKTELEVCLEAKEERHATISEYLERHHPSAKRCSEAFLRRINKNVWIDDAKLMKHLKSNLSRAQSSGSSSGIFQYAENFNGESKEVVERGASGCWPAVVMPGGCQSTGFRKDDVSRCEAFKTDHFPVPVYARSSEGNETALHHNVGKMDSLYLESKDVDSVGGGHVFFHSELDLGGCVGLYVQKIEREKRFEFLSTTKYKREDIEGETTVGIDVRYEAKTFSTLKYKYYLIVRCTAGRRACNIYEAMVKGIPLADIPALKLSRPNTLQDFACSSFYGFYMQQCAENARRLAFKFSKCLHVSVPLREVAGPCAAERLRVPSGHRYDSSEIHWRMARNTDFGLRKVQKMEDRKKREELFERVDWTQRAKATRSANGSLEGYHSDYSSSESFGSMSSSDDPFSDSEEAEEGTETEAEFKKAPEWERKFWKKRVTEMDPSVGIPPMGREKRMQYENTLKIVTFPHGGSRIQIHAETVNVVLKGEPVPAAVPRDGTCCSKVAVRLPPLQGYVYVNLKEETLRHLSGFDCSGRLASASALHVSESSLRSASSFEADVARVGEKQELGESNPFDFVGGCGCNDGCVDSSVSLGMGDYFEPREGPVTCSSEIRKVGWGTDCHSNSCCHHCAEGVLVDSGNEDRACPLLNRSKFEGEYDHPFGEIKDFETELLYDSQKRIKVISPNDSFSEGEVRRRRSDRQAPVFHVAHTPVHLEHYENALRSTYHLPSDCRSHLERDVKRGRLSNVSVNPHHASRSSFGYVQVEETVAEMVRRSMGARSRIVISNRDPGPVGEYEGVISVGCSNEDYASSSSEELANRIQRNVHYSYKQYRPACCVESFPMDSRPFGK